LDHSEPLPYHTPMCPASYPTGVQFGKAYFLRQGIRVSRSGRRPRRRINRSL